MPNHMNNWFVVRHWLQTLEIISLSMKTHFFWLEKKCFSHKTNYFLRKPICFIGCCCLSFGKTNKTKKQMFLINFNVIALKFRWNIVFSMFYWCFLRQTNNQCFIGVSFRWNIGFSQINKLFLRFGANVWQQTNYSYGLATILPGKARTASSKILLKHLFFLFY